MSHISSYCKLGDEHASVQFYINAVTVNSEWYCGDL